MSQYLPILGTILLALGVAAQGYHVLRKSNERPSFVRGLIVGSLLEVLGFFVLLGLGVGPTFALYVVGGFVGGIALAFLWAMAYRPGEPRP